MNTKESKTNDTAGYSGFFFYKTDYNGKLPESLISANRQMNRLNLVAPGKIFEKEREKNVEN